MKHQARLTQVETVGAGTYEVNLSLCDAPMPYRAGQWANVHIPMAGGDAAGNRWIVPSYADDLMGQHRRSAEVPVEAANAAQGGPGMALMDSGGHAAEPIAAQGSDGADVRSFSMIHHEREASHTLSFAVAPGATGVSKRLCSLEPGTLLLVDGPWGVFTLDALDALADACDHAVFVGTGTGLAPLRAMCEELLARKSRPSVTLLQGCRSEKDVLWSELWSTWSAQFDDFRYEVTVSRPSPGWCGRRGYVQEHFDDLNLVSSSTMVFLCGRSAMIAESRKLLKERYGFDRRRIRGERFD